MKRAAAVALAALPLLAGCGPSYDAESLALAVGPSFTNLYVRVQQQVGRPDASADDLGVSTACTRGGPETDDAGPGDDWMCLVTFADSDGRQRKVLYEVTLKPTGCFTADGPPTVVGDATVVDARGVRRLNPVYAFDGCLPD